MIANPQPDKFTKISNELFEAFLKISKNLSPYESTIWLSILRKTYGFGKKEDWINFKQLEDMTGIIPTHLYRTKRKLLKKNMITCNGKKIGIQKDYEQWSIQIQKQKRPKQVFSEKRPKQVYKETHTGPKKRPIQVPTKERKKLIQKKEYAEFVKLSEDEYQKLIKKYGEGRVQEMIEKLDNYKGSNGKTYKSDYRAILSWVADEINGKYNGDINYPQL